jgi:cytochrome oxidase assembly protein ShyY1
VLPVVVLADMPAPGLEAVRERPDTGVDKHREYMLTWSALAATALVLWIALNVRRAP